MVEMMRTALPAPLLTSTGPLDLDFTFVKSERIVKFHSDLPPLLVIPFAQNTAGEAFTQPFGTAFTQAGDGILEAEGVNEWQGMKSTKSVTYPWFAVSAEVTFNGGATTNDFIGVGAFKDLSNQLVVRLNKKTNTWQINFEATGLSSTSGASVVLDVPNLKRIGMMLCGFSVSAWAYNGIEWIMIPGAQLNLANIGGAGFRPQTGAMADWNFGMLFFQDVAGTQTAKDFRVTNIGYTGMRGFRLVTNEDGSPYVENGKYYCTPDQGSPGVTDSQPTSLSNGAWGIFEFDPDAYTLKQVGGGISYRAGNGPLGYYGDQSCCLLFDRTSGKWHVFVTGYGDYSIAPNNCDIWYQSLNYNPIHRFNVLTELVAMGVATGSPTKAEDPMLYRHTDGVWHFVYGALRFGHECYHATAASVEDLLDPGTRTISAALSKDGEGPTIRRVGQVPYIFLAGNPDEKMWVFDLNNTLLGELSITYLSSMDPATVGIPHCMFFPVPVPGGTKYVMITFNQKNYNGQSTNYFSWGDTIIYESQVVPGLEHPYPFPG